MGDWCSPLKPKVKQETVKAVRHGSPGVSSSKDIPLFKQEKLTLSKGEARKFLDYSPSLAQTAWCQRWLEQLIRERSLPPQIAGADGYGYFCSFLNPEDALKVLDKLREDFQKIVPLEPKGDFDFLTCLPECGAYHEHLLQLHKSDHNSQISDDDL